MVKAHIELVGAVNLPEEPTRDGGVSVVISVWDERQATTPKRLSSVGFRQLKSKLRFRTSNPSWSQRFTVELPHTSDGALSMGVLQFLVMASHGQGRHGDTCIGCSQLTISSVDELLHGVDCALALREGATSTGSGLFHYSDNTRVVRDKAKRVSKLYVRVASTDGASRTEPTPPPRLPSHARNGSQTQTPVTSTTRNPSPLPDASHSVATTIAPTPSTMDSTTGVMRRGADTPTTRPGESTAQAQRRALDAVALYTSVSNLDEAVVRVFEECDRAHTGTVTYNDLRATAKANPTVIAMLHAYAAPPHHPPAPVCLQHASFMDAEDFFRLVADLSAEYALRRAIALHTATARDAEPQQQQQQQHVLRPHETQRTQPEPTDGIAVSELRGIIKAVDGRFRACEHVRRLLDDPGRMSAVRVDHAAGRRLRMEVFRGVFGMMVVDPAMERVSKHEVVAFGAFLGQTWTSGAIAGALKALPVGRSRGNRTQHSFAMPTTATTTEPMGDWFTVGPFCTICSDLTFDIPHTTLARRLEAFLCVCLSTRARQDLLAHVFDVIADARDTHPLASVVAVAGSPSEATHQARKRHGDMLRAQTLIDAAALHQWCVCVAGALEGSAIASQSGGSSGTGAEAAAIAGVVVPPQDVEDAFLLITSRQIAKALFCGWMAQSLKSVTDRAIREIALNFLDVHDGLQQQHHRHQQQLEARPHDAARGGAGMQLATEKHPPDLASFADMKRALQRSLHAMLTSPRHAMPPAAANGGMLPLESHSQGHESSSKASPMHVVQLGHYLGYTWDDTHRYPLIQQHLGASLDHAHKRTLSVEQAADIASELVAQSPVEAVTAKAQRVVSCCALSVRRLSVAEDCLHLIQCNPFFADAVNNSEVCRQHMVAFAGVLIGLDPANRGARKVEDERAERKRVEGLADELMDAIRASSPMVQKAQFLALVADHTQDVDGVAFGRRIRAYANSTKHSLSFNGTESAFGVYRSALNLLEHDLNTLCASHEPLSTEMELAAGASLFTSTSPPPHSHVASPQSADAVMEEYLSRARAKESEASVTPQAGLSPPPHTASLQVHTTPTQPWGPGVESSAAVDDSDGGLSLSPDSASPPSPPLDQASPAVTEAPGERSLLRIGGTLRRSRLSSSPPRGRRWFSRAFPGKSTPSRGGGLSTHLRTWTRSARAAGSGSLMQTTGAVVIQRAARRWLYCVGFSITRDAVALVQRWWRRVQRRKRDAYVREVLRLERMSAALIQGMRHLEDPAHGTLRALAAAHLRPIVGVGERSSRALASMAHTLASPTPLHLQHGVHLHPTYPSWEQQQQQLQLQSDSRPGAAASANSAELTGHSSFLAPHPTHPTDAHLHVASPRAPQPPTNRPHHHGIGTPVPHPQTPLTPFSAHATQWSLDLSQSNVTAPQQSPAKAPNAGAMESPISMPPNFTVAGCAGSAGSIGWGVGSSGGGGASQAELAAKMQALELENRALTSQLRDHQDRLVGQQTEIGKLLNYKDKASAHLQAQHLTIQRLTKGRVPVPR